jgi:hypothetical protein
MARELSFGERFEKEKEQEERRDRAMDAFLRQVGGCVGDATVACVCHARAEEAPFFLVSIWPPHPRHPPLSLRVQPSTPTTLPNRPRPRVQVFPLAPSLGESASRTLRSQVVGRDAGGAFRVSHHASCRIQTKSGGGAWGCGSEALGWCM